MANTFPERTVARRMQVVGKTTSEACMNASFSGHTQHIKTSTHCCEHKTDVK